jgi:hypothetical protein
MDNSKFFLSKYSFLLLLFSSLFLLMTCDLLTPGLGEEIDIETPVVGIESHSNGDYIGGIVELSGFVSDDSGIESVTLSNGNNSYTANFNESEWSVEVDTTIYQDGEYDIVLQVEDTAGKTFNTSVLLIVDNKPPTVIVTTPSLYNGIKFNDQIEIKGEASDRTRVKEVWIHVYDSTDSLVQSDKATGTTSWFYTLDSTVLTDLDEHYINVIAIDFTRNQNSWFYHISDVYALSNDIANVPNIEKIDGVDNQGELITIGPAGIISASFDTIRLTESGPDQLTLDIDQSSNTPVIAIDGITVLGPNSIYPDGSITGSVSDDDLVIAGTLEIAIDEDNDGGPDRDNWFPVSGPPAADGKSVDWSHSFAGYAQGTHSFRMRVSDSGGTLFEHTAQIPITVDNGPPSIQIDSPAAGAIFTSSFTIDGSASDGDIVSSVEISLDGGSTWTNANTTPALPSDSVSWDYDFTVQGDGSTDGDYDYQIRVTDGSGRISLMDRRVIVDATIPTAQIDLPPESSTVNGTDVLVRGTSNDNRTIDKVYLSINPESVAPPADVTTWLDEDNGVTGKYSWTYTLDSTTFIDGNYDITVVSVDSAGNESTPYTRTITVDQESDRPVINFNDIDKTETSGANNVLSGANSLLGSITDDDFIDPTDFSDNAIQISIDGGAWQQVDILPSSTLTTVYWSYDISALPEGSYTVKLRARDGLSDGTVGASSVAPEYSSDYNWNIEDSTDQNGIPFILNSGPPSIDIDAVSYYQTVNFSFSGDAYDGSGLQTYDHDANGMTPEIEFIEIHDGSAWNVVNVAGDSSWTFPVDVAATGDGARTYQFRATDQFGKTAVETVDINIDTVDPVLTIVSPVDGSWSNVNSLFMNGTSSDANGISLIEVSTDNTNWVNLTGTVAWNGLLDISSFEQIDKELYFRSTDDAGRTSVESIFINIDRTVPTLTETTIGSSTIEYVSTDYSLDGALSDNLTGSLPTYDHDADGGTAEVEYVELSINSGAPVQIPVIAGNWNYPITFAGGTFNYELSISDKAGNDSVHINRIVIADNSAPSIDSIASPTGAEPYISGTAYSISGMASDSGDAGLDKVYWWTDDQAASPPATTAPYTGWDEAIGTVNWTDSLNLTTIGEGDKTLHLFTVDKSGNVSGISTVDYTVDQAAPTLTEDISGIAGTATVYRNTDIDLGGDISDGTGIASLVASYSKNGGALTNLTSNMAAGRWDSSLPISLGDGGYELQIVATDNVGRTTTLNRNIVIDTSSPDLTVESPVDTELVDSNSYTISGKISDNGGVGVTELQYSRDNTNWTDITIAGLSWFAAGVDFSSPIGAETSQGARTLYIRATDGLNPEVVETINFNYDTEDPVLTETLVNTEVEQILNSDVNMAGQASDSNALTSLELIINGGAPSALSIDADGPDNIPGNGDDNAWSYTHPDTTDGSFALVFRATDASGRTTEVERNLLIDTTDPNAPVISSSPGNYVTTSLSVTGTATDATSGISSVEYSIDGESTWNSLSGTDNWFGNIDISLETVGAKTVYVRTTDRAGNMSPSASQAYIIDRDDPLLTINGFTGTVYRDATFTINGTMDDRDLGLVPVSVTAELDSVPLDLSAYPIFQSTATKNWSQDIPVSPGDNGNLKITIRATDAVGRVVVETVDVGIDTSDPTVTVTTDFTSWFGNNAVLVEGTAFDGGSQLKEVQYSYDNVSWSFLASSTPWSGYVSIPTGDTNPLYIRSVDNVGNYSTVATLNVKVDTSGPVTSMVSPLTLEKLNGASDLSIDILVQDIGQSGVITGKVKVSSTDFSSPDVERILIPANAEFNDTWSFTLPAASIPGFEGQMDVNVEFTDIAGNRTIQSFPILVDRTDPATPVISSHSENDIVNKTITVSGSASDTQGLDSVIVEIYNDTTTLWEPLVVTGTYSWSTTINTETYDTGDYDTNGGTAGTQISLRVTANDAAGNSGSATRALTIDQNSDRPVITINNLDTSGTDTLKLSRTIYGSLTDDDGASLFEISEDNSSWTTVSLSGSAWQYNVSSTNGTKNLYFRVLDGAGLSFATNEVDEPRIIGDSAGEIADVLVFKLDTVTPEIYSTITADRFTPFDFTADTATVTTNMPFGGNSSHFALKVLARDANFVDSVVINIPGLGDVATVKGADELGYEVYTTAELDISSLADGSVDMVITVTDNSGLTSTATRTILLDNSAPDVTYLSPRSSLDVVNGDIPVRGLASDSGSALERVEYKVGYSYGSESWQNVSGSLFNWEIDFSGVNKIDYYAGLEVENVNTNGTITLTSHGYVDDTPVWIGATTLPTGLSSVTTYYIVNATADTFEISTSVGGAALTYAAVGSEVRISKYSKDSNGDSIWELPVIVRATDYAGNSSVVSDSEYIVFVDPSGDKPNPIIVYPDPANVNRIMGGIIRIFGTAEDDDGVDSVYMQIDVDGDGDFDAADISSDLVDWYNGGEGQIVTGSASWNININTNGEFNPVSGTRPINFRVRAKDIYGTYGPWSDVQHIEVDNSVPKIGSSEAPTLTQGATVQNYVSDMYIKGNWTLNGTIEDESDISDIQVTGDITGSLAGNPSWFTDYSGTGTDGYRMQIPINTSGTGIYVFTVTAIDNSDPMTNNSATFRINYDNTAPTVNAYDGQLPVEQSNKTYRLTSTANESGSGLERVAFYFLRQGATNAEDRLYNPMEDKTANANRTYLNNVYANGSTISFIDSLPRLTLASVVRADEYTLQHDDIIGNTNVRKGGLVKIGGLDRLISSVDYGTGTISWSGSVDTGITDAYIAYALIVDNDIPETPVWNPDNTLASITNDDGDFLIEELSKTGTEYTWDAYIDSKEIPDGPIEIHWVAFDKSGNYTADFVSTEVLNHRPMLASVLLGTDLNGENGVEAGEKVPVYSLLDGNGDNQAVATSESGSADASPFTAKGETTVEIEIIGGNGALQYEFFEGIGTTNIHSTLQTIRVDDVSAVQPITVTVADFTSPEIGEGDKNLVFKIWDSTEETTIGVDSQWAELTVPMIVDVVDDVNPMSVISPFFWTDDTDNSLYENDRTKGHIELTGVVDGIDPDISGQITVRGTAYDDQRIEELYIMVEDMTINSGTTITFAPDTYSLVSQYSGGSWSSTGDMAALGWAFSAADVSIDQTGHRVAWELDWDTSLMTGVAGLDKSVKIVSKDKGGNYSVFTIEGTIADDTTHNLPYYEVDVVPYITGISTSLDAVYPANPSAFNRSALGYYPVRENEVITVHGFNLQNAADAVSIDGVFKTPVSGTASSLDINVGTDTATGAINVVTNSISSQNNSNDNGQDSNKEDNNLNNSTLNDDRYLYIWSFGALVNSNSIADPIMRMDDSSNYYMSYGANANRFYLNKNGTAQQYDQTYNQFNNTMVAFDANGNIYGSTSNTDRIGDSVNGATSYTFYAKSPGSRATGNTAGYYNGTNKRRLELAYNSITGVYDINRVEFPKMEIKGSGTDADPARVYMTYFDGNSVNNELKFRYGTVGTNANTMTGGISNNLNSTNPGSATGYQIVADTNSTYPGGNYSDVDALSNGTAVMTWYDAVNRQLIFSYNTNPAGATQADWQTNAIVLDTNFAGWYVDMTVDDADGIHIAYYSSGSGDLRYAYLSAYNTPATVVTVDSYLSTGTQITINTRLEGGNYVPYISYFQPSFVSTTSSVKVAWREDFASLTDGSILDDYSGSWEVMTIPSSNVPVDGMVCNGVPTGGAYADQVFISYYTDAYYERTYLK